MKHIAYTHREFRLCEWPEEPKPNAFGRVHLLREDSYLKAVTSAMENGIAFADQEGVKQFIFKTTNEIRGTMLIWQPKDGDNWPAPEWTEIEEHYYLGSVHKVAVLKSESVEKKEEWKIVTNGFGMPAIKLTGKKIKVLTPSRYSVFTLDELQSIADRLNQSTPKE